MRVGSDTVDWPTSCSTYTYLKPMWPLMLRKSADRPVRMQYALAVCALIALSACASKYARVPARLDLVPYGRVAIVTFSTDQANRGLSSMATQRVAEALLANQNGIELLELGTADSALVGMADRGDGTALAQALGRDKDVPAVFIGQLKMSQVKPHGRLDASGVNLKAGVSAELTVRLLSTRTGGTVWRSSSVANGTVGRLAINPTRLPSVAMRDKDEAYNEVVSQLVADVTRDLKPTWVKQ
jgi:hypothetical protein